jgi:hypothetical protein
VISKRNRIYPATRAISVGSRGWWTIPGAVFFLPDEAPGADRRLLGWICWGDDVDGDLAEGQRDTWSGLHA